MGWLGKVSARFPLSDLIMFHRREGLHLCEHDSTVWIHFCLLEILMLWWICTLSSCICGSEEEEKRRASLSIMSHLAVSLRLSIMLGMWLWGRCCFAKMFKELRNRGSPVLQEDFLFIVNPNMEAMLTHASIFVIQCDSKIMSWKQCSITIYTYKVY